MLDKQEFLLVDGLDGRKVTAIAIGAAAAWLRERLAGTQMPTIALVIRDKLELVKTMLALSQLDVCIVPLDPGATQSQTEAYLNASGAFFVITDQPDLATDCGATLLAVAELNSQRHDAAKPATFESLRASFLFFTSGSTGTPKGVWITPQMLAGNVRLALTRLPYEHGFVTASILPAYHTFTLVSDVLTAFALQTKCVVLPDFEVQFLGDILEALARHSVNSFSAVPVIFEVLAKFGGVLRNSDLRFATSGAAPLTERLGRLYADAVGHTLIPCYGMTEAVCFISISEVDHIKFGSAGKPVIALRIVDDNDQPVRSGTIGSIQICGETVIREGYFGSLQHRSDIYADGSWLRTGDIGFLDNDGILFITGRSKNMIIRGGEKIYLEDVEALFDTGTVVGVPLEDATRETFVFFVEQNHHDRQSVLTTIRASLGARYMPDRLIPIAAIPKSPTGKLHRKILAEGLANGSY